MLTPLGRSHGCQWPISDLISLANPVTGARRHKASVLRKLSVGRQLDRAPPEAQRLVSCFNLFI